MNTTPEIWFKAQRALRTFVQALIVLVPIVNLGALALADYLTEQTYVVVSPTFFAGLNGIVVVTALIMGGVARLMAVPGVNDWLTKIGLGSVPKRELESAEG